MIVGFWKQRTISEKWFEEIGVSLFTVTAWNNLWGSLSIEDITEIDLRIKNLSLPYATARKTAQDWKRDCVSRSGAEIVINPKIDSKSQRRIQCSIPFNTFWRIAKRIPSPNESPKLFDICFENPVISNSRKFNQD